MFSFATSSSICVSIPLNRVNNQAGFIRIEWGESVSIPLNRVNNYAWRYGQANILPVSIPLNRVNNQKGLTEAFVDYMFQSP